MVWNETSPAKRIVDVAESSDNEVTGFCLVTSESLKVCRVDVRSSLVKKLTVSDILETNYPSTLFTVMNIFE
jgi:hypothetical protein